MTEKIYSKRSFFRQYIGSKQGVIGAVMLLLVIMTALFAPWIAPYDPYEPISATTEDVLAPPGPGHLLGQDEIGRDVFSSVVFGARISLLVGFAASLIMILLGCTVGLVSGYVGGRLDILLMRITDGVLVIPTLPLMLVIIAVAGRGIGLIIMVIGLFSWPYTARVIRAQVISIKERQFVMRAEAIGVSHFGIVMVHILPQVLPVIFASITLDISAAILAEAGLSFLGLGDPTLISWGSMINQAFSRGAVSRGAWWYLVPPGFLLAWVTLGLNLVSNAIQEIVNPRLRTHNLFDERKILSLLGRLRNYPSSQGGE